MNKTSSGINGIEYCCICRRSYPLGATHSCYALGSSGQTEPRLKIKPSELELRIRQEVLDTVDIMSELLSECEQCKDNWGMSCGVTSVYIEHITNIKDRLNLLWGEDA